jgi:hypothetical protein
MIAQGRNCPFKTLGGPTRRNRSQSVKMEGCTTGAIWYLTETHSPNPPRYYSVASFPRITVTEAFGKL